jgi:YidC/Oxa1 family membrane protein insertase
MKELQTKYKNDSQKMNMELAKLYKEVGVNPLAGCLPMFIQMPFLIGVFYAIRDFSYVQEPSFLWMQNLANPDPLYILPIISAATTYFQSKQTTSPDNQQAKMMLYIMPLFIGYISFQFSGGLVLYWVVSNIFQIGQQWFMYRDTAHV